MDTRRLTAKKVSISEVMKGKYVKKTGFESSYVLSNLARRLSRVRILGLVVDKFTSSDGKYATLTLDDSSDTIRCKSFVNVKIFDKLKAGDLVDVIGKIREYNEEIYVMPEIVRKITDSNFETLRTLELEKINRDQKKKMIKIEELKKNLSGDDLKKTAKEFMSDEDIEPILELENNGQEKTTNVRTTLLKIIRSSEEGIDYKELIQKSGLSEVKVDQTVQELLEDGTCYEPKPGKIKKL